MPYDIYLASPLPPPLAISVFKSYREMYRETTPLRTYVVRQICAWDQLDIRNPGQMVLVCTNCYRTMACVNRHSREKCNIISRVRNIIMSAMSDNVSEIDTSSITDIIGIGNVDPT